MVCHSSQARSRMLRVLPHNPQESGGRWRLGSNALHPHVKLFVAYGAWHFVPSKVSALPDMLCLVQGFGRRYQGVRLCEPPFHWARTAAPDVMAALG